jgi:hypothetical protein
VHDSPLKKERLVMEHLEVQSNSSDKKMRAGERREEGFDDYLG